MYRGLNSSMTQLFHIEKPGRKRVRFSIVFFFFAMLSSIWGRDGDVRLEVARQWSQKGEYDKAVHELRLYLSEHPDDAEIYARIGSLRAKQGNFKLAGENYKIALLKKPDLMEARAALANSYEKMGEMEKAAEERKRLPPGYKSPPIPKEIVNQSETDHDITKKVLAEATLHKEARPGGSTEANFSPALDSGSSKGAQGIYAQKEFQEALRLYREKKSDSALGWLRKSLVKSPRHPGAYYLGGVIRYERGEVDKAAFNFKRSLDYPDRGFNSYFYLGRIYQKKNQKSEAIQAFQKYLSLTKSESGKQQVLSYLAQLHASPQPAPSAKPMEKATTLDSAKTPVDKGESGEKEKGIPGPELKTVAATTIPLMLGRDGPLFFIVPDKSSPSGKKMLEAYDAFQSERYEKAENLLKEIALAYGGSENAEAASLNMASINLQLGLWENARTRLSDYIHGAAKDSLKYADAAHYLTARVELGLKNGEAAEKHLLKIKPDVGFGPSQEEVDYRLSQAGELMQDSKKWSTYLEKAYTSAKSPLRKAMLAQKLGALHSRFGNSDRASEYYRKSTQECHDSSLVQICSEAYLRMADLTFKKKEWKSAIAQYKQFLSKYPDHKESAWVQYQIANIYKATNNFESALNAYKKVIDNYPDSYWASQAKWKREDTIWQKEYEEVLD